MDPVAHNWDELVSLNIGRNVLRILVLTVSKVLLNTVIFECGLINADLTLREIVHLSWSNLRFSKLDFERTSTPGKQTFTADNGFWSNNLSHVFFFSHPFLPSQHRGSTTISSRSPPENHQNHCLDTRQFL